MPVSGNLPPPPPPADLEPLADLWPRGRHIVRCHASDLGATEFNPGLGPGHRFDPIKTLAGKIIPTLYGSNSMDGALSETVFHSVPVRGPDKAVLSRKLDTLLVSTLASSRDLRLVQLHGHGAKRLGTNRQELIESEADQYETTRKWAEALHESAGEMDGLIWVSRQYDTSFSLVLFGDRVERRSLQVIKPPLPLAFGSGLEAVQEAAEKAAILLI